MTKNTRKERNAESTLPTGGNDQPAIVAGIGVGTGGAKSLKSLLSNLPSGQDTAYMLIRHPETSGKDLTIRQLKNLTDLEVVEATDGMPVLADRLHVVPPDRFLNIEDGKLTLKPPVQCDGLWMPIDHFFCSLAEDRQRHACGIVLSGQGSDGTLGLSEIKAAGGRTIVENPKIANHHGMSQSAIDAGVVQSVLPVETMAGEIATMAKRVSDEARRDQTLPAGLDPDLRAILDILLSNVGHDFRCYKPNTIIRRVHRRMSLGKIDTFTDYARFLGENPEEIGRLQKDLLIGVTEFFRQPLAWEILEEEVIAPLVEAAQPGSEIRTWVPGCSTGQEAYSLAMMLTEQAEKSGKDIRIQVFATDSAAAALAVARAGSYSHEDIGKGVPSGYLKRFFTRKDSRFQIIKVIRERIVFAPQNITADPPFSRLDLISCRNLLMYLDQQVQQKIFAIFHFALREGGFLFLGSAETIGERTDLFEPISKKWRIYRRIGVGRSLGLEIPVHPIGGSQSLHIKIPVTPSAPRITLASTAQQVLMDRFAPACVMIDRKLQVLYVHGAIEEYLTFPAGELTLRVVDMAREGLRARLRGAIDKCVETGRPVLITARVRRGSKSVPVKATVSPLRYPRSADGLLLVTFEDQQVPAIKLKRHLAEDSGIRQLEDELKITREELQSTIEQLEGSNDQFKASNEEVTAANEELQAANEELETSKEELQSLNEELNTINGRLNEKVEELESTNNDVVNLLSSTAIATLFLDKELRIKRFTQPITGLFSLIPSDAGRPIADVLRRFTDETLLSDTRRVLIDLSPLAREVQADDGRWYMRRITPYRTQDDRIEGVVITFVDFTERYQMAEALKKAHERATWLARFPEENPNPVMRVSANGDVLYCNPASAANSGWGCKIGEPLPDIFLPLVAQAMAQNEEVHEEIQLEERLYGITIAPFSSEAYANIYGRDITERKQAEDELRRREIQYRELVQNANSAIIRWLKDGTITFFNEFAQNFFGYRENEIIGKHVSMIIPERESTGADLSELAQDIVDYPERYVNNINENIRKDGSRVWMTWTNRPILDESGRVTEILAVGSDITERKQMEQALQESEQRVRLKLETILSPEGDMGNLALGDIIDVEAVRSMMVDFSALTNITVAILDLKGTVLVGEAWQDICTKFHRIHPDTCRHCIESDTQLTTGVPPGEARLYKCRNNMWDVATPIMVGGQHMGNVFTGQFFFEDESADYELFRAQARQYGFDENAYMRALDAVPRLSRDAVDKAISFLMKFSQTLSQLSYGNIKLARSLSERDALMNSLRESEERLRLFIENAPASLAMFDCDMRYLSVSKRWLSDYGLGDRGLLGMSHYEVFPEVPAEWKEAHRRGLAGEVLRADEDRFERTDGTVQWVRWEIHPWFTAAGAIGGIVIFTEDITKSKQAEEVLQRYRLLAEHTQDIVLFVQRTDGRILEANEAAVRTYGYSREELLSLSVQDLRASGTERLTTAQMDEADSKGILFETFHHRKDGSLFPVEVSSRGATIGDMRTLISVVRDITERKATEAALHRNEEQLRRAQEIAHLGSWELDLIHNRLSWSDEVYRIFGLRPQAFGATYEAFLEHVHPDDRNAVDAAYSGSLRENRDGYEIEHRVVRKDTGEIRIVQERCQHFRDKSGVIIRSVGMVHDITERKQAEDLLRKNAEQLEAANKELESFGYTVSHDLRAPLRAIEGYSRMILRKHADKFDDDALNKFNVIRNNTQMMGQLIDDLLAFSRLDSAQLSKTRLDMDSLIREIWKDMTDNETERRIRFRILDPPPGFGDRGLIRQVLTNMLANAVKFTKVREDAVIEAGGYVDSGESVYYVRDNGAGFDMKYYDKLFGVFQRLHQPNDFEGTGVGLATVQRIIHRHGGRVWAEGEVDKGAAFFFTLPGT